MKTLRFEPPFRGLGRTYDVHIELIGKCVVDLLLVLIELFFKLNFFSAEALYAEIDRKSAISLKRGQFDSNFQVEGDVPTNYFCTDS